MYLQNHVKLILEMIHLTAITNQDWNKHGHME